MLPNASPCAGQPQDRLATVQTAVTARRGRLYVIAAPSGAGKTSLVRAILERRPQLRFSISCTTRQRRPTEQEGRDYFFVDHAEFERRIAAGAFLEYAQVFDNYYGTLKAQVEGLLVEGHDVILEIDWQGARQVRASMPECASIFILPPSLAELERRLRGRATDSDEVIERRLRDARSDTPRHTVILSHALGQDSAMWGASGAPQSGAAPCADRISCGFPYPRRG